MVDGKADAALFKALDDRAGIRRAVAAVTLRRGHIPDRLPAVRKLLTRQGSSRFAAAWPWNWRRPGTRRAP